jgi:MFS family permease
VARKAGAGAAGLILMTLCAGQFLMMLDSSVMNVSIATVAKDVDTTVTGIQTAITLYTLVMASFMITGGKIGQIIGRKRAFAIGCVIYGCGSMTTALAPSLPVLLIGWSGLEGLGAALILPAIVALVAANFDRSERPRAYGLVTAAAAVAVAVGPIVGGFFTTYLSWRYVFAGEVVIVIAILVLARRIEAGEPERKVRLDLAGTALSAAGLALIVLGVLRSGTWGFVRAKPDAPEWIGLSPVIWLLLGGAAVLALFIAWENRLVTRGGEPLVNPKILRVSVLRGGLTSFFFQYFLQGGMFFAMPLFLSIALGLSAIDTGVRLLPLSFTLILAAAGIPKVFPDVSPRRVVRLGFLGMFAGLTVLVGALEAGAGAEIVTVPLLLAGLGMGALASQLGSVTVSSVPDEQSGEVGGLQNTVTNLGISVGTALTGAIIIAALSSSFLTGVEENSAVPRSVQARASTELSGGIPFLSDDELENALDEAPGVSPRATDAIVEENEEARLVGLRTALAVLALLALVGLFFTGRIPTRQPAAAAEPAAAT